MAGKAEVRTKLTLDAGAASALLKNLRSGFGEVNDERKETQQGFVDFARQTAAMALGTNLNQWEHDAYAFARGFYDAAAGGDAADTAIAGLITTVQGLPWDKAKQQAQGYGDDLDEVAVKAGVMGNDVGAAYQAMLELTGATRQGTMQALQNVEQISTIAGVLEKSAEGLSREYGFMSEGIVKTKGQLFQLLQTTGIFGKDTKKASEYWAGLTEKSRIEQLQHGLGQVAERMGKATPSAKQLEASVENLYEITKEKLGEPLMNELVPVLTQVRDRILASIPQIERFAKSMSKDVGAWVKEATTQAENAFKYLADHQQEISDAIKEGVTTAKGVVDFILAHKEEIALAFGAKAAMPALGAGAKVLSGVMNASANGIGGLAGTGGGALAGAGAVVAFSAAVAAWAAAVDQWQKLMAETGGGKSEGQQNQDARKEALMKMGANPSYGQAGGDEIKRFEELRASFVAGAKDLGEDARAAGELADKAWAAHSAARSMVKPFELAGETLDRFAQVAAAGGEASSEEIGAMQIQIDQAAAMFQAAVATQNEGSQKYMASLLLKSKELQGAFLTSATMTGDAFNVLAKLVEGASESLAKGLREKGASTKAGAAAPAAPKVMMTGGQTFKIQQDFRDQDPDRVAYVFERDIAKVSERRLQAGTTQPFGG